MISGRDHFKGIYQQELELEAEWLHYGAAAKVDSLQALLIGAGIRPRSILELGCGTGAVIRECQRRALAAEFTAIDYAEEAITYLQRNAGGIRCSVADITSPSFRLDASFDVVVVSHVLEHLEDPLEFLRALRSKISFRYLITEVPLEDLFVARIKGLVRDRQDNSAGHVQFYTATSFRRLLRSAELEVLSDRRYVPIMSTEAVRFVTNRIGSSRLTRWRMLGTGRYLPRLFGPVWSRLYYAHYSVLSQHSS